MAGSMYLRACLVALAIGLCAAGESFPEWDGTDPAPSRATSRLGRTAAAGHSLAAWGFEVDAGATRSPLPHFWERIVGSGHATLGLRADWQRHLAAVRRDLGFQAVRFHGVMDDDMSTYTVLEGKLGYSFVNVDAVYDYILSQGMTPYVELSFMPTALASGNTTLLHYHGNICPPTDMSRWYDLVFTFVTHMVQRYGLDEVAKWQFECWNEPNGAFWTGSQAEYFALYNATVSAVKDVSPQLRLGGPATEQAGWVPDLINYCHKNGLPLDFVSTHQYPTDPPYDGKVRNVMAHSVAGVLQQMQAAGAADLPLVYSEYNDGLWRGTPVGPLHDTVYAAAFIAHAIPSVLRAAPSLGGMSWWTFSDVFEEQGQLPGEFSGMWGLLTVNGIPKPSYRAFQLLHGMSNQSVPCQPAQPGHWQGDSSQEAVPAPAANDTLTCLASVSGSDSAGDLTVQVLLTNYQVPSIPSATLTASVSVGGFPAGARSQLTRIDKTHANSYQSWLRFGSPTYPTRAQLGAMNAASILVAEPISPSTRNVDGTQTFQVTLEPSAVALLTVTIEPPAPLPEL